MSRAIAYIRCSTEEQADSRAGLEAQRTAILAEAHRRGWDEADVTFFSSGLGPRSRVRHGRIPDRGYEPRDEEDPGRRAAQMEGRGSANGAGTGGDVPASPRVPGREARRARSEP